VREENDILLGVGCGVVIAPVVYAVLFAVACVIATFLPRGIW
jgi:hypothetical protein